MTLSALGIFSAAGAGGVAGDYELISTSIISGTSTTSVVFDVSTLASTYRHLQIRALARTSSTSAFLNLRLNGDSASNYGWHLLRGDGSSVTSAAGSSQPEIFLPRTTGSSETANTFGAYVVDILDSFSTTKNKTIRNLSGSSSSPYSEITLTSGHWRNTASLTSVTFLAGGGNLVAGSRFSLYGIRG
jgi:hypothetical protein